jgi:hypothetical protein
LEKSCKCGGTMNIRLRTVIFQNKVDIENVPVFSCSACQNNEVFADVKPILTGLIGKLGSRPDKQLIKFDDHCEVSYLMKKATEKKLLTYPVEAIVEDRVNELLDLLILARSLADDAWIEDIRTKLSQISGHSTSVNDLSK